MAFENLDKLLEEHNLTKSEYNRIVEILGREPNLTELGVYSVMWSEHCSYKSSRIHLKKLPTEGKRVVQGPGENAGVVDIGDGYVAVFKIESHNHPSFIEPYQGAATGVGGILRDIFTMGARPIAVMDSLRFGELENPLNRRTFKGVVAGISGYGNSVGVPTVGGETCFDDTYTYNPLVNVFCLGITKKDKVFYARAKHVGAKVFYAGAKTGRDGIHGATMASAEFDDSLEEKRPNVQVGDPFKEKLLIEACLEAMEKGVVSSIQDMGAAGLTSSSVEMADRGGKGIEIDVSKVPQREEGMTPYEILLSESQERMLIVAEPGREQELREIFKKWDLDIVEIGEITDSGNFTVLEDGKIVAQIPVSSLTSEAPKYDRPYLNILGSREKELKNDDFIGELTLKEKIESFLDDPNIGRKNWVFEQYDHMVHTNTVVLPGKGVSVIRLKGTDKFLALTVDGNPDYVYLNPYEGTKRIVSEAYLNISVAGAEPVGATNCLNFGNPEKQEIMGEFKFSVEGMGDASKFFEIPITGGNVSFYNETNGVAIKPTPVYGLVGIIEGEENILTLDFKNDGDSIYLIGNINPDFSASYYLKKFFGKVEGTLGETPLGISKKIGEFIRKNRKLINSANDVSQGGLFVSLIDSITESLGFSINIPDSYIPELFLFGEAPGLVLITVSENFEREIEEAMNHHALEYLKVGKIKSNEIEIFQNSKNIYRDSLVNIKNILNEAIEKRVTGGK